MAEMSPRERRLRKRCKNDYTYFAPKCLKIRNKAGKVVPLELNKPQHYVHARLEDQLAKLGRVRGIIVKGRKQGVSTYIGGRHYHKITHQEGQRGFILTHLADATNKVLFPMVKLMHDRNNPLLKPVTGNSNTTELIFPGLMGGYGVGTAGSPNVGRSDTIQYLHGSEVAFWPHADAIAAGLIEAVPDEPGTEVVLESTTNGPIGFFSDMWNEAFAGNSLYAPIFIPWFWSDEYRSEVPDDFRPSREEEELIAAHGLDDAQLQWRREKISGTLKTATKFMQEYPCTAEEAFMTSGEGCYISPTLVAKARRTKVTVAPYIPIIVGIDPARGGQDRSGLIDRQGRKAGGLINTYWNETDAVQFANRIVREIIKPIRPKKVVIDATEGLGAALCDILNDMGFSSRPGKDQLIVPVKYSGTAFNEELYENVRAELAAETLGWLSNPLGVELPEHDAELQGDLCAAVWGPNATRHTRNGRLLLESKDQIRKRLKRSPDKGDALFNTFAVTVIPAKPNQPRVTNTHAADPSVNY